MADEMMTKMDETRRGKNISASMAVFPSVLSATWPIIIMPPDLSKTQKAIPSPH
ncbi:hypothetical protein CCACVL1_20704 [Corchorus capsularis]|uniref:Uncharacterized protein n=1 Tax=Corchorus capsularis TaxID=210143 RepID=A0A1R3HA38_COCAP|nr:hypothetical protein CCACVL1_20704 [Corchorus capsularis]